MPNSLNTVAIVDDDDISLLLITKFLEQKQAAKTILRFSSGFDALNYLENNAERFPELPSVILLDITMPMMNGWQFLKELNKINFAAGYQPAVCIISASATIDFEILKNYPAVKGYIVKPVIPNKLIAMMESIAGIKRNDSVSV